MTTRPKFPIGFTVYVDRYAGVVPDYRTLPKSQCWVTAVRAAATVGEGEDGEPVLIQPAGWEYQLHQVRTGSEWGWVPEADIAEHYSPSEPQPLEAA
jgi:hypothetical protein